MPKIFTFSSSIFYINDEGTCLTKGYNEKGQLGIGHNETQITFTPIQGLPEGERVTQVACRNACTMIITNKGRCYGVGNNVKGQLGVGNLVNQNIFMAIQGLQEGERVVQVAFGALHTMILTDQGKVYGTGNNQNGQLGVGNLVNQNIFMAIQGLPEGERVVQVFCGSFHTMIVTDNRRCYGVGLNSAGQLGLGNNYVHNIFTHIQFQHAINSPGVIQVVCSRTSTLIVTENGHCYGAGLNRDGQLGVGVADMCFAFTPIQGLPEGERVVQAVCNIKHTMIVTDKGRCYGTGNNDHGQLGFGPGTAGINQFAFTPIMATRMAHNERVVQATCGDKHTMIVTDRGRCYGAGFNENGRLGVRDRYLRETFTPIHGVPEDERVVQVACSQNSTMVVTQKNRCYGAGEVGDGTIFKSLFDMNTAQTGCSTLQSIAIRQAITQYGLGQELYDKLGEPLMRSIAEHANLTLCVSQCTLRPRDLSEPINQGVMCACAGCRSLRA